jgi:hypothetical protein
MALARSRRLGVVMEVSSRGSGARERGRRIVPDHGAACRALKPDACLIALIGKRREPAPMRTPIIALLLLAAGMSAASAQSTVSINHGEPVPGVPGTTTEIELVFVAVEGRVATGGVRYFEDPDAPIDPWGRHPFRFEQVHEGLCTGTFPPFFSPRPSLGILLTQSSPPGQSLACRVRLHVNPDAASGDYAVVFGQSTRFTVVVASGTAIPNTQTIPSLGLAALFALMLAVIGLGASRRG